jgi:hypothetical protein
MGAEPLEILESAVSRLSEVQRSLERSSAVVLQEVGAGNELARIDGEMARARRITQQVEAMLCEAMVDPNDLITAYSRKQLNYQCM